MQSNFQRWWLYACFAAVLLAGWAGGFGVIFMLVFIIIYLIGVALIEPEQPAAAHGDEESRVQAASEPETENETEPEPSPAGSGTDEA